MVIHGLEIPGVSHGMATLSCLQTPGQLCAAAESMGPGVLILEKVDKACFRDNVPKVTKDGSFVLRGPLFAGNH